MVGGAAFDIDGIILCHFIPQGTTINSEYYCKVCYLIRKNDSRLPCEYFNDVLGV